jgi:hypothetical protein
MALNTGLQLAVQTSLTKTDGLASASANVPWSYGFEWPDGTGADQANRLYQGRRTLTASSTEDLDLSGTTLLDSYGVAIAFARIKALIVKAAAGNANNVIVGGASANQWVGPFGAAAHTIAVKPNGTLVLTAPDATGWAVTAGTGDLLKIANSAGGTSVTYDIFLIGASV